MSRARDIADRKLDGTDLELGDNDKAVFGAGSDLQIYHSGGHSFVSDQGTGNLYLQGSDNVYLRSADGLETLARFAVNGANTFYYDNSVKVQTTATGIDVTGTVTSAGLTVNTATGNTSLLGVSTDSGTEVLLADQVGGVSFKNVNGDIELRVNGDASTAANTRRAQKINENGDIAFYEDTGTTAKFFWDASAERLGIGTSSPNANVEVYDSTPVIRLSGDGSNTDNRNYGELQFYNRDTSAGGAQVGASIQCHTNSETGARGELVFATNHADVGGADATERMRIDSSGNVGIGTSSPVAGLQVNKDWTSNYGSINISHTTNSLGGLGIRCNDVYKGGLVYRGGTSGAFMELTTIQAEPLLFRTNAAERMRIDSSGNVGIGTSSPREQLEITGRMLLADGKQIRWGDDNVGVTYIEGSDDSYLRMGVSGDEAMRIDSSGNLCVGNTTPALAATNLVGFGVYATGQFQASQADNSAMILNRKNSNGDIVQFHKDGTRSGGISVTGSSTAYNTSSDYRLKEDWQPMVSNFDRVSALKPVNFAWKADGSRVDGFLAHELAEVVPEAVTGTKDAMRTEEYEVTPAVLDDEGNVVTEAVMGEREVPDYQGIDQSKLVPLLTAALQDAIAEIEALKADVAQLKGTN